MGLAISERGLNNSVYFLNGSIGISEHVLNESEHFLNALCVDLCMGLHEISFLSPV